MNPGAEKGYALDFLSVVRHVATMLDGAAPAALSAQDLTSSYHHTVPTDLSRVRHHHELASDHEARKFLVERALTELEYRGKTSKSQRQLNVNGDGFSLAIPFDKLRYDGRKLRRNAESSDEDEQRELRAAMREDRTFHVDVLGSRGARREIKLQLHELAKAMPLMSKDEFAEFVADIRAHGVYKSILVRDGWVLDGRHRVAVADALGIPVRVEEFTGTEEEARERILSENVHRRHLTVAQRGLIVREFFLPQAQEEAKQRELAGKRIDPDPTAEMRQGSRGPTAAAIAAKRSSGMATVRTVETMAPIDNAPETKERVRSGEIKTAAAARRAALEETGAEAPADVPILQPESAYKLLGHALRDLRLVAERLEAGERGAISNDQFAERLKEIRDQLEIVQRLERSVR